MSEQLRSYKIRAIERMIAAPEDSLSVEDLKQLADQTGQFAQDCGPFDPATQTLLERERLYRRLRFLKLAQVYKLDPLLEGRLENSLPADHYVMLDHSSTELMTLAEQAFMEPTKPGALGRRGLVLLDLHAWKLKLETAVS